MNEEMNEPLDFMLNFETELWEMPYFPGKEKITEEEGCSVW